MSLRSIRATLVADPSNFTEKNGEQLDDNELLPIRVRSAT
jgi:hypothetical protein